MPSSLEPFAALVVPTVLTGVDEKLVGKARRETLAIPESLRAEVAERDQGICRCCGRYVGEQGAVHHINFGGDAVGMGGRRHHELTNLLTVGWTPQHDCHGLLHGTKLLWLPYAQRAAQQRGVTMLQLKRWDQRALRSRRARADR